MTGRRLERSLWALTALGIALRLHVYLLRLPIWTDEAKLAVSLLDRSWAGLTAPLAFGQVAPVAFMWLQKAATLALGFSEYSLRLIPLTAAVASMLLFRRVSRRLLDGTPAVLAVALFAVSYYPVRHAAELKPYATDLLASLVLTALAVEWLAEGRTRWLLLFALAAPAAILLSYPATFVAAGILAALALPVWRDGGARARTALALGALTSGLAFALHYLLIAAEHRQARTASGAVWPGDFPPLDDLPDALGWLLGAHTGRTFGYPLGADHGGSLLTFIAFLTGAVVLARAPRGRVLAVLLLPFVASIGGAALRGYPYGGSGRVSQHLVPAICLLAAVGAGQLTALAKSTARQRRAQAIVLGALVGFGLLLAIAASARPYRDRPDRVARDFARWFWDTKAADAVLVDGWEDLRLEFARPSGVWTPGGAGYRVNQQIYFERRRRGGKADLGDVSRRSPLRVAFLGTSVEKDRAGLAGWLDQMELRYELVGRERHELGPFAAQHGVGDWVELYNFVPR